MKSELKTGIIMGIVIVGITSVIGVYFESLDSKDSNSKSDKTNTGFPINKSQFKKAPELKGVSGYINTNADELKKRVNGNVVLYDIWTYSCINCLRTLPYIEAWNQKYSDKGLVVIGVHSPEFEFEKDYKNVDTAVKKFGIKYPVVLDNDMIVWDSFGNHYWPRKYLVDDEGFIRYDHIGEGSYDETERIIQKLLDERSHKLGLNITATEPLVGIKGDVPQSATPEIYFGYNYASGRNQFGNPEGFNPEKEVSYSIPKDLRPNSFYLDGVWKNLSDSMTLSSNSGKIVLQYTAKQVNIVSSGNANLSIYLDGNLLEKSKFGNDVTLEGKVITSDSRLYNIIKDHESASHVLEIRVDSPGFEIFTFTFG